jgi:hypothetical protein
MNQSLRVLVVEDREDDSTGAEENGRRWCEHAISRDDLSEVGWNANRRGNPGHLAHLGWGTG